MRVTLAHEMGVDARGSKDIYDLYLVYLNRSELQLIIYMKILFTFVSGKDGSGAAVAWTDAESANFVAEWKNGVATAWTARNYAKYKNINISIHVSLETKIGASYPGSHWQVLVEKLPADSTGKTSFVWRDKIGQKYDVQLDSQDNQKKTAIGDGKQTGSIHEFGHMLGLGDEYTADASAALQSDKKSIMNSGSEIRPRHYATILQWAGQQLAKVQDKIDELNDQQVKWDKNSRSSSAYM